MRLMTSRSSLLTVRWYIANETSQSGLYWALKGGGNIFGVVTASTHPTYPHYCIWAGIKMYPYESRSGVLDSLAVLQTQFHMDIDWWSQEADKIAHEGIRNLTLTFS
ncbi:hypothetical protein F4811DRAFT_550239 [Daldinia bambusicola]|nr:hypothetical protein F4811DRAFT_550239 [Daldinia bambusicola]